MVAGAAFAAGTLFYGFAQVPVVPEAPMPLGGYTERGAARFEPAGDVLACRAVAFRLGNERTVVAVLDALTVPEALAEAVEARIPPGVRLVLCATHTHCAPDSQMANPRMTLSIPGIANFDREYADWLARRVGLAVRQALENAADRAGSLEFRSARAPFVRGRRPGAVPDDRAWALYAGRVPLLAGYSAHPTLFGPEERRLRGDWPAALAGRLGCPVVVGALGDASAVAEGSDPQAQADAMAAGLSTALASARPIRVWAPGMPFVLSTASRRLPPSRPHPGFAAAYEVPEALGALAVRRFAPPSMRAAVLRAGSLDLLFLGAEPGAAVGRRLERALLASGAGLARVVAHAGGWAGYVLEPDDYARGGYEATLSFYGPGMAGELEAACRAAAQPLGPAIARPLCGQRR